MTTEFKLYKKQQRALITPANEILYGGAAGGGKSYLARVSSIAYSLEIPGLITYLFRRTFKEVLSNHVYTPGGYLELLADLIDQGECVFSKSDYSFSFPSTGSRIQLAHSQYENDIYAYQGAQIGFLIIDEATHFTPTMIRFIRSRVRLGSMKVPDQWKGKFPRILYTSNPGGVGHHYFKSNFVDFGEGSTYKAPEDEGSMLREYIPSRLQDNKVLIENDPDYAARLKGMGDTAIVQAMLEGDWELLSSGGLADVWRSKYHVVKPFNIPSTWTISHGYDYGSSNPAAYVVFAESDGEDYIDSDGKECWVPKGTTFVIGEVYFANKRLEGLRLTATQQAEKIVAYQKEEGLDGKIKPGPADNSIFNSEPGHVSVADEMAAQPNNVKFIRSNKAPGSRVLGLQEIRNRLVASTRRPMEKPGLYIFNNCYHTIRTLPNLENDSKNTEDIDSSGEDHLYDVIRYHLLRHATKATTTKVQGA